MSNLENQIRAALEGHTDHNETNDQDETPIALNDDDGLRAIILGEIHNHADHAANETASRHQFETITNIFNEKEI